MLGADFLHLNLDLTVARIHVVELFLTGFAEVRLHFGIEIFADVDYLAHPETEVIQGSELIVPVHFRNSLKERGRPEYEDRTEIEIIPQGTCLAVDCGMTASFGGTVFFFNKFVMVRIEHVCTSVLRHLSESLEREISEVARIRTGVYHDEIF